jgi:ribosome maturation factor RimP
LLKNHGFISLSTGIAEHIEALARPVVEASGAFLVEILLRGENRGKVLEVSIDTDEGVTTEQCALVSRDLSKALDAADVIRGAYQLIVSSPGTDKPLKFLRQFKRNIGRSLAIRLRAPAGLVDGVLVEIDGETIVVKSGAKHEEIHRVPFGDIAEARVKTPW